MSESFTDNKLLLLDFPERLDGERIFLRPFQGGDGEENLEILVKEAVHHGMCCSRLKTQ